jgi:hypothetical protein
MSHRKDILDRTDDILRWIEEDRSKAYMCRELVCRPGTLENYLKKLGIQYAGNQGGRGKNAPNKVPAEHYLKKGSLIKSHALKLKLYEEGIKEPRCEKCGITDWEGQVLSFHLDHINGNRFDNRLCNLRILCPNCHSQTPTYGANKLPAMKKQIEKDRRLTERLIVPVLKTGGCKSSKGSNPLPSALVVCLSQA